jgi:exodeoxyribonuclease-3
MQLPVKAAHQVDVPCPRCRLASMKIATWNVNSLRIRLDHVLNWWDATQPDVLCLQETKVEDDKFPREPFAKRGLQLAIHGQKSYNGVAIISRLPITDVVHGFQGEIFNDHARIISATVGGLRLANAYVPHGEDFTSPKYAFKQEFYRRLADDALRQMAWNPNFILMGDFNVATDARDVDEEAKRAAAVLYSPEARQWLADFKQKTGLHDAFRLISEEGGIFSWWDYRDLAFQKNRGMRIDYHFISNALKPRLANVYHCRDERTRPQPSDHVPVLLTLNDE